jgi:hypothetical protein
MAADRFAVCALTAAIAETGAAHAPRGNKKAAGILPAAF